MQLRGSWGAGAFRMRYEGALNSMMRRMRETQSEDMRAVLPELPLQPALLGLRRAGACAPEALGVKIGGPATSPRSPRSRVDGGLRASSTSWTCKGAEAKIATELLKEIRSRLRFLRDVGLGYLTLDRPAPSLSGGEGQRIRLASQIGSELTGVIYVLDEPSIGLHQRDNRKLLAALKHLRDIGNTVVVVEHDREAMEEADWLVDFGPGAGRHGGEVVAAGTPARGDGQPGEPHRPLPVAATCEIPLPARAAARRRPQDHASIGRAREQPQGRRPSTSRSGCSSA